MNFESQSEDSTSILEKPQQQVFYNAQAKEYHGTDISSDVSYRKCEKLIDSRDDSIQNQLQAGQDSFHKKTGNEKYKEFKSTFMYNGEESKIPLSEEANIDMCGGYQDRTPIEEEIPPEIIKACFFFNLECCILNLYFIKHTKSA